MKHLLFILTAILFCSISFAQPPATKALIARDNSYNKDSANRADSVVKASGGAFITTKTNKDTLQVFNANFIEVNGVVISVADVKKNGFWMSFEELRAYIDGLKRYSYDCVVPILQYTEEFYGITPPPSQAPIK